MHELYDEASAKFVVPPVHSTRCSIEFDAHKDGSEAARRTQSGALPGRHVP